MSLSVSADTAVGRGTGAAPGRGRGSSIGAGFMEQASFCERSNERSRQS